MFNKKCNYIFNSVQICLVSFSSLVYFNVNTACPYELIDKLNCLND